MQIDSKARIFSVYFLTWKLIESTELLDELMEAKQCVGSDSYVLGKDV